MFLNRFCAGAVFATACAVATAASAQEAPPAVSAPNVKADFSGGALGGGPAMLGSATLTVPLGHSMGLQLDAAGGLVDRDARGGGAAHIFYRDPRDMMVGATFMSSRISGPWDSSTSTVRRYGVEAEFYFGDFSVLPSAGLQNAHGDSTGYAGIGGLYYINPNFSVGASVIAFSDARAVQVGLEYQPITDVPLSFIGDVGVGNDGPGFVLIGLRYSFGGPSKTIKDRDRFDDPGNIVRYMNTTGASSVTNQSGHKPAPAVTTPGVI